MVRSVKFGSSLAFLILAALTGLVGFFIVYHYASFDRPIQRFAVVIDAGSTQTRSNLYSISINPTELQESSPSSSGVSSQPVSDVIQVRELDGCINGGPLAAISSLADANRLLGKCLPKFARKIKRLDFLASSSLTDGAEMPDLVDDEVEENRHLDASEMDRQLALLNHRVNSVTHIHLGATAGMRALELLDPYKAEQRIHWIRDAINKTNSNLLAGTVFMNPGFVGIIEGTNEASFGWLSVNFACNTLQIESANELVDGQHNQSDAKYLIHGNERDVGATLKGATDRYIGTLELGGASAQMALQVGPKSADLVASFNKSLQADSIELFGKKYQLATRSDLCLGMSQAIFRTNFILLREYFNTRLSAVNQLTLIEIENPCKQNGSRAGLSAGLVDAILNGACLEVKNPKQDEGFKQFISALWSQQASLARLQIVGTGNVDKCDRLLANLVEPQECMKLFSLCPESKNKQKPPTGMPFVTISGYNKALQVLNLSRQQLTEEITKSDQVIGEKLGGHPIDYAELVGKTRSFCSMDIKEFPMRFPKMNKNFYDVNCLQMVYIRKLLTEFYQFGTSSWHQIRFLLFPIAATSIDVAADEKKKNVDIGWTLGLLLNETSWELSSEGKPQDIVFHHGASVEFIIRTTVFLMFACVLIAASIVVFSLVLAKRKFRSAYNCHSAASVESPPNSL